MAALTSLVAISCLSHWLMATARVRHNHAEHTRYSTAFDVLERDCFHKWHIENSSLLLLILLHYSEINISCMKFEGQVLTKLVKILLK